MHPRIEELFDHLDRNRGELQRALEDVPLEHHQTQPDGAWSVVNVLEHLAMVEGGIATLFRKKIDEARAAGLGAESDESSVLENLQFGNVLDRTRKIQGADAVRPVSGIDTAAAWKTLGETRAQLRTVIMSADGMALGTISHPHRAFGLLNVYQWLLFLGDHEARHAAQIREIGAGLTGGAVAR